MSLPDSPEPDSRPLRRALAGFATGVSVVTADGPNGPVGITVNSFTSVSLDPPTILWSLGRRSDRWPVFSNAERFAVQVLDGDGEEASRRFAWGDSALRPEEITRDVDGPPMIEGWVSRFLCRTTRRIDAGDHMLILAEVERFETRDGDGLVFFKGTYSRATRAE